MRFFPLCAARLVELVHIQPGQEVLDVGTGTGAAALPAAKLTGPGGRVVGVDIAQEMLAQARRKAAAEGLTSMELRVEDAERLSFSDNTFEVVLSASSIFFLPDMLAGLREWWRVAKPGGAVAIQGYGTSAFQPISDLFEARIRSYGVTFPLPRHPFSWQRLTDPQRYTDLLRKAGYEDVGAHTEQLGYYLHGVEEWWDVVWNSGFRGPVALLPPSSSSDSKRNTSQR